MGQNLKKQMIKGTAWSFASNMTIQVLRFAGSIVLARLLLPEYFGLVAMVTIITAMSQTLVNSGMSASLIQNKIINDLDFSTVFIFNFIIAIILTILIISIAPLIASFFDEPKLLKIVRYVSLSIILYSLTIVQRSRLQRDLNFKSIFWSDAISVLAGFVAAIIAALNNMGPFALVIQVLVTPLVLFIVLWAQTRWIPLKGFNKKIFIKHWHFSSPLLASALLNSIFENVYTVLIGRFYSPHQLGIFSKAVSLKNLTVKSIIGAFDNVTFAGLSKVQDDELALKVAIIKIIKVLLFITLPMLAILAATADEFVIFLLGKEWGSSAYFLKILCVEGALIPIITINIRLLMIKGKSILFFKLALIKKAFLALLYVLAIVGGEVEYYAIVLIVQALFSFTIHAFQTRKLINLSISEQLSISLPFIIISLVVFFATKSLNVIELQTGYLLTVKILVGSLIFLSLSLVFMKNYLLEVKDFIKQLLNR